MADTAQIMGLGITRGASVVTTPEEIDIINAGQLRAALLHAAGRPGPALVADMTRTLFCDSPGCTP